MSEKLIFDEAITWSIQVVSNHILSVATNVSTNAFLLQLCIIVKCKIREKYVLFMITNLFLNNCL